MCSLSVEFRDRNDHFSSGFVHLDTKNVPYRPRVRRCADSDNLLFVDVLALSAEKRSRP